jgi:hypothetical protein
MKIFSWLIGCLLLIGLVLSGCESGNTPPSVPAQGQPVPPMKEFQGQQGPFPDRGFFVVQRPEV